MAGIQTGGTNSNTTSFMSKEGQKQLDAIIALLAGGGAADQRNDRAARTGAVNRASQAQQDYSKNAAFTDAQAAMAAQLREALVNLLPGIVRSAEASGTSQNALRALLTQQAASEAAEGAASLGLKAAVDYGNVNTALGSVIERLTAGADPVQQSLMQALQIAKGAQTTTPRDQSVTMNVPRNSLGGLSSSQNSLPEFGVRNPFGGMSFAAPASTQFGTGGLTPTMTPNAELTKTLSGFTF